MRQNHSALSTPNSFVAFENGGEKFSTPSCSAPPAKPCGEGPVCSQWFTACNQPENALILVLQGQEKKLLDDFLHYLADQLGTPPLAASPCEILQAIRSLSEEALQGQPGFEDEPLAKPCSGPVGQRRSMRAWMLEEIDRVIESNLDNDNFKVADLAKGLNYCVMQLHRIVKEITDLSSAHYIRRYRLQRSQHLLAEGRHNVCQVAFMVGFKSPEHFARCFRNEFGECPSEFRAKACPFKA